MIVCGYQGCGKTTYCKNHKSAIDLDSSNFNKTEKWEAQYLRVALSLSEAGYNVFISAHPEVIFYCLDNNIKFELLIPAQNKEAWRSRLEFRYNINPTQGNLNALKDFEANFDKDMIFYRSLTNVTIHEVSAKVVTNIANFFSNEW